MWSHRRDLAADVVVTRCSQCLDEVTVPRSAIRESHRLGHRRQTFVGACRVGCELGRQCLALERQLGTRGTQALVPHVQGRGDGTVGATTGLAQYGTALAQYAV